MTYQEQHEELCSWIKQCSKEVVELVLAGKMPADAMQRWIEGRLWELSVVYGFVMNDGPNR